MKKYTVFLMIFALLLACGCNKKPVDTPVQDAPPVQEQPQTPEPPEPEPQPQEPKENEIAYRFTFQQADLNDAIPK